MSNERIAKKIHKVYCKYHLEVRGEEYWTKGDYSLLDEPTKDADRYMADFVEEEIAKAEKRGAEKFRNWATSHILLDIKKGNLEYNRGLREARSILEELKESDNV